VRSFPNGEVVDSTIRQKNLNTGILRNRTNGGDGPSGMVFTEASRLKISNSLLGNKRRLGIPHTKETLEKIGNKSRGRKPSEETLRKRSISLKNVGPYSKERIAKAGLRSGLSRIGKKTGKRIAKEYEE
jgi:hypothetical protein